MKFTKLGTEGHGYILADLPNEFYNDLKNSIKRGNLLGSFAHELVGNIQEEYTIKINTELKDWLEDLAYSLGTALEENPEELYLPDNQIWVNYQKKNDFNPLHIHSGKYSFVIWYDIPYFIEEERSTGPDGQVKSVAGRFSFTYVENKKVKSTNLPVDRTWNKKIAMFPSNLYHQVYPFYTSNKYRITIAGNIFEKKLS